MSEIDDELLDSMASQAMDAVDGVTNYHVEATESTVYFTVSAFAQADNSKLERQVKEFIRSSCEVTPIATEVGVVSTLGDHPYPDFAIEIRD